MEYRQLGKAGLKIPVLSLGTGTFGGTDDFFKRWGQTNSSEAARLVDICLERGINFFDTANVYSMGESEKILGAAIKGKRDKLLLSTKASFTMGSGPNDKGSSRYHLIKACEDSLRRLSTDYLDVYFMHGYDENTPIDETLSTLDHLVTSGKVRYIGCSNFAAWQVIKSLSLSEKMGWEKYVIYQGYYSLIGRDYEQELMPMIKDQHLGLMVWSPLGWGRLTGKIRRGKPLAEGRIQAGGQVGGPEVSEERLFAITDILGEIENETGRSFSQIAINWLLQNNTVSNVIIGARNEKQLLENLEAVEWQLSADQKKRLDDAGAPTLLYPHWVGQR